MRESNNGQYVETLGNQPSFRVGGSANHESNEKPIYKVGDTRPPTLVEVMLDPEFLTEFRSGNMVLFNFMNMERML